MDEIWKQGDAEWAHLRLGRKVIVRASAGVGEAGDGVRAGADGAGLGASPVLVVAHACKIPASNFGTRDASRPSRASPWVRGDAIELGAAE